MFHFFLGRCGLFVQSVLSETILFEDISRGKNQRSKFCFMFAYLLIIACLFLYLYILHLVLLCPKQLFIKCKCWIRPPVKNWQIFISFTIFLDIYYLFDVFFVCGKFKNSDCAPFKTALWSLNTLSSLIFFRWHHECFCHSSHPRVYSRQLLLNQHFLLNISIKYLHLIPIQWILKAMHASFIRNLFRLLNTPQSGSPIVSHEFGEGYHNPNPQPSVFGTCQVLLEEAGLRFLYQPSLPHDIHSVCLLRKLAPTYFLVELVEWGVVLHLYTHRLGCNNLAGGRGK